MNGDVGGDIMGFFHWSGGGGAGTSCDEEMGNVVITKEVGTCLGTITMVWADIDIVDSRKQVLEVGRGEETKSVPEGFKYVLVLLR